MYAESFQREKDFTNLLDWYHDYETGLGEKSGIRAPRRDIATIEVAYRQAVRVFESEINRLSRKIDELDRKRSRVTQTGSLKELARSRDLGDLYERLQWRCDKESRRLRVLIGACEAELAEVLSER